MTNMNSIHKLEVVQPQYRQLFEEIPAGLIFVEVLASHDRTIQEYRFLQVNKA